LQSDRRERGDGRLFSWNTYEGFVHAQKMYAEMLQEKEILKVFGKFEDMCNSTST
jgi:hypothetical protein